MENTSKFLFKIMGTFVLSTLLITACDRSQLTEVSKTVAENQELPVITSMPDTEQVIQQDFTIPPGLYGPDKVKSGKNYTYTLIVPSSVLSQVPNGSYKVFVQERCNPNTSNCPNTGLRTVDEAWVSSNSANIKFTNKGPNKKWRIAYVYVAPTGWPAYTGAKEITGDPN